jgi:hypothetical protein
VGDRTQQCVAQGSDVASGLGEQHAALEGGHEGVRELLGVGVADQAIRQRRRRQHLARDDRR